MGTGKRKINTLIIHCSASEFGSVEMIRQWHRQRGFKEIGYHYVILNAYPDGDHWQKKRLCPDLEGKIEPGRPLEKIGAHTKGHNHDSVGVCLVGDRVFTSRQLEALREIHREMLKINPRLRVLGHYEVDPNKTCPNLGMEWVRKYLSADHEP